MRRRPEDAGDPALVPTVSRSSWLIAALVLAIVGLAIPTIRHFRETPPPPPPPVRLTLGAPPGTELGSGDDVLDAAISADERHIVFVATSGGITRLWRRSFDAEGAEVLKGTDGAQLPAWSRAGDAILFFAAGQLKRLTLASGQVQDIAEATSPAGATWLIDDTIVFAPQSNGVIRRIRDGVVTDATALQPGDRAHVFPFRVGAGGDFVYTAVRDNGRRIVRLVHDGSERDLTATSGHGQIVGGRLLAIRDDMLMAQAIDERSGLTQGQRRVVASRTGVTSNGRGLFVASDRLLLSAPYVPRPRELVWFDADGSRRTTMGEAGDYWQVRLSPDDQYAAVTFVAPLLRTLDIAQISSRGRPNRSLTLALAADNDPVWSPDGRRIAFRSLQRGRPMAFTTRTDDVEADPALLVDDDATPTDWQGSTVLVQMVDATSGADLVGVDSSARTRAPLVKSGFNDTDGRWSPDQGWLAHVSDESGRPDIYASPRVGTRIRVSFGGGTRPRWSRDGRSLFFLRGTTIVRATRAEASSNQFAPAVPVVDLPGIRDFDVAHQRNALIAIVPVNASTSLTVSVVINWKSML